MRRHTLVVGVMGISVYSQVDGHISPLSDDHVPSYVCKELGVEYYAVRFDEATNRWRIDLYDANREAIHREHRPAGRRDQFGDDAR